MIHTPNGTKYSTLDHTTRRCKFDNLHQTEPWYEFNDEGRREALELIAIDTTDTPEDTITTDSDIESEEYEEPEILTTEDDIKTNYELFRPTNTEILYEEYWGTKTPQLDKLFLSDPEITEIIKHSKVLQDIFLDNDPGPDESEEKPQPMKPRGPYAYVHDYLPLDELITTDMKTEDFTTDHCLHDVRCGNEMVEKNDLNPFY